MGKKNEKERNARQRVPDQECLPTEAKRMDMPWTVLQVQQYLRRRRGDMRTPGDVQQW